MGGVHGRAPLGHEEIGMTAWIVIIGVGLALGPLWLVPLLNAGLAVRDCWRRLVWEWRELRAGRPVWRGSQRTPRVG
jgi:hypothetical protein